MTISLDIYAYNVVQGSRESINLAECVKRNRLLSRREEVVGSEDLCRTGLYRYAI